MFGKKDKNLTVEAVRALLEQVIDPELEKSVVAAGMVEAVEVEAERVRVRLALPTPAWEPRALLEQELLRVLGKEAGDRKVELTFGGSVKASP